MSAVAQAPVADRKRFDPDLLAKPYGYAKGLWLSNLLGFALFFTFTFDRVIRENLPGVYPTEMPMRLIALWLILDRNWRVGRVRLVLWDWAYILLIVITGFGLIANSLRPELPVDVEFYRRWVGELSKYYLAFLVVRESCHRVGFRPDIMFNWLLVALGYSAALGIAQSMDIFGLRAWSYDFYNMVMGMGMSGPTAARGTATHANSLAFELMIGMAVLVGRMFWRKPKLWEIALFCIMIGALGSTQSRGGLIAFLAGALGCVIYLFVNRRPGLGFSIAGATLALIVLGLGIIELYNIKRFQAVIYGEQVRSASGLGSFQDRIEGRRTAMNIFSRYPLFGSSPTGVFYFNRNFQYYSPLASRRIVDGIYFRMPADAGIFGLLFVLTLIGYMISFIRPSMSKRPYAFAVFICGIVIATHGLAENFLVTRGVIIVSCIVAITTVPGMVTERGREASRLSDGVRSPLQRLP